jgi:hypothetical protein
MKIHTNNNPREFKVGLDKSIILKDCADIELNSNEQVTFKTNAGAEYDVCRKEWGYYATPSMNDRLKHFGFKTALVKNVKGQLYIMIVEKDKVELFYQYLDSEKNSVLQWFDEQALENA